MNEIILTIIFVLIVTAYFTYLAYRQKKSAWTGTLTKKKQSHDDESGTSSYLLIFKTDTGKKAKIRVATQQAFDQFELNAKYQKKSGQYHPEKI